MMKCALVATLALCLLAGPALSSRDLGSSRQLTGLNKRAVCTAKSGLKIRLKEAGRCDGVAQANCDVFVSVYDEVKAASAKWEADDICQENSVLAAATAFARAYVKVFVSAVAQVTCYKHTGARNAYAWGCGWSIAEGSGTGAALAKATAQAWADADPNKESFDAFCDADVEALGSVLVKLAESAQADVCSNNQGTRTDFEAKLLQEAQCAVADVLARASAGFCEKQGKAYGAKFAGAKAFSKCEGSAEVIKFRCDYYG